MRYFVFVTFAYFSLVKKDGVLRPDMTQNSCLSSLWELHLGAGWAAEAPSNLTKSMILPGVESTAHWAGKSSSGELCFQPRGNSGCPIGKETDGWLLLRNVIIMCRTCLVAFLLAQYFIVQSCDCAWCQSKLLFSVNVEAQLIYKMVGKCKLAVEKLLFQEFFREWRTDAWG